MINVFNLTQLQLDDNTLTVLPFKQQIIDQASLQLNIFYFFFRCGKEMVEF